MSLKRVNIEFDFNDNDEFDRNEFEMFMKYKDAFLFLHDFESDLKLLRDRSFDTVEEAEEAFDKFATEYYELKNYRYQLPEIL